MTTVDWVDLGTRPAGTELIVRHFGDSAYIEIIDADNYTKLTHQNPYDCVNSTNLGGGRWETILPTTGHWYVVAIGDGDLFVDLIVRPQVPPFGGIFPAGIDRGEFSLPIVPTHQHGNASTPPPAPTPLPPGIPPIGPINTPPSADPPLGGISGILSQLPKVTTEEANINATLRALNTDATQQQNIVDNLLNRFNQLTDPTNPSNDMSRLPADQREALLNDAKNLPAKLKDEKRKLWEITGPAQILSMDTAKLDELIKQKEAIANAYTPGAAEATSTIAEVKNSQRSEIDELKKLRQTYDDLKSGKIGPSDLPDPPEKTSLADVLAPGLINLALLAAMFRLPRASGILSKPAPTLLAEADAYTIFRWSGGGGDNMWRGVNKKLYRNQPLSAEEAAFADNLTEALSKLPDYTGIVQREIPTDTVTQLNKIAAKYPKGQVVTEGAFTASTRGSNEGFTSNLTISIMSRHGKDISGFSAAPEQLEVLFNKGTRFLVLENRSTPQGQIQIILREVD